MLGDAVLYAASRATHNALENVSRRVTWMALAGLFLISALVFALMLVFWVAEPRVRGVRGGILRNRACLHVDAVADRPRRAGAPPATIGSRHHRYGGRWRSERSG